MKLDRRRALPVILALAISVAAAAAIALASPSSGATRSGKVLQASEQHPDQVLEWNQIFIDTLIATNTPNSSSQRFGAIVHTAIFDAYNGIERRYTPIFVHDQAPSGASRRAAVIAAAYTALVGLFPSRQAELDASYAASLAALSDDGEDDGESRERGIAWGTQVAQTVLAWRAGDGFGGSYPPFIGGTAVGQWRPTPPSFAPMSAQGLAFTSMFVLASNTQFRPGPPRGLTSSTYTDDFNTVKTLGRRTGSTRTDEQTALARFWDFNASVHWNQAANQIARANHLSTSDSNRLLATLNIAMADTAITTWSAKRHYGAIPTEATWRPVTAIPLADTDGNPDTAPDPDWLPLINTPSHPEYAAGHPSLNGAAATILLANFGDAQTFTLTATGLPSRTYSSITQARQEGNDARVWGGMHYPSTVAISDSEGETIADYVNANAMQPFRGRHAAAHRLATHAMGPEEMGLQDELAQVRAVTARFHDLDAALAAGYELGWVNGSGQRIITGCVFHPTAGAMGYHYFNAELMADLTTDALQPEALVYAPGENGTLRLAAVEWVVRGPNSNPPGVSAPPSVLGMQMHILNPAVGFWLMHAWVWKPNPAGMFADWNPDVSCP